MEFDKIVALKEPFIPRKLYRYCSLENEYVIQNLERSVVYLSAPTDFNDPYDTGFLIDCKRAFSLTTDDVIRCYETKTGTIFTEQEKQKLKQGKSVTEATLDRFSDIKFSKNMSRKKLIKFTEEFCNEHLKKKSNELEMGIKKHALRICCFTTRFDNMSMWYHYAKEHQGICIEYDTTNAHYLFRRLLFPVMYGNYRFDANEYVKNFHTGIGRIIEVPLHASLCKSNDWAYEDEWRFVLTGGLGEQPPFMPIKINAVYLGRKISEKNKQKVLSACKMSGIHVYKVDLCDNRKYTLTKSEIIL